MKYLTIKNRYKFVNILVLTKELGVCKLYTKQM